MEGFAAELALKSGWEEEGHKRFQLTPAKEINIVDINGNQSRKNVEQALVAGKGISACYSRLA